MPVHPQIAAFLATLPPHDHDAPVDVAALRVFDESHVAPLAERHPVKDVRDDVIAGVPVRVYQDGGTDGETDGANDGTLVYLHGGAYFLGSLDTHDHVARHLATATGLRVISVGYRLAPEHAFPAALDDATAVVLAVAAERPAILAVAGDSAGGTIAAVVAAEHSDVVTHQIMYYPALDWDLDLDRYPSLRENAVGYGLETAGMAPYNQFYIDSGADVLSPRVSPVKREDLTGLPAALVLTGEFDPMRDEGELYAQRLRDAGVSVEATRYDGAGHGFVQHFFWLPEYAEAFAQTARFLGVQR